MSTLLRGVDAATGNALTPDDPRQLVALVAAKHSPEGEAIVRMVLDKRAAYRTWLTLQQRKWQSNVSRRPQRGNHHDSWDIRERYVRC